MFPRKAVASIVGIGGFSGAMAGMAFQRIVGRVLQASGNNYTPIFLYCGLACVTAWLIIQLLAPRLEAVELD